MGLHVVVGAGPVGTATALRLVELGHQVRVVTRHGSGPPTVERISADANDAQRLTELAAGAQALYNCANPPYHRWPQLWPPLAAAILTAAERTGAVLVTMSNLYGYGPISGPIREDLPLAATTEKMRLRGDLWRAALAAHEAGRVRATEARASDYVGPGAASLFTTIVVPAVRKGKGAVPANLDVPHSLSFTADAAATMAVLGTDSRAWGRAWHVPTAPAVTLREAANRFAALAGLPQPRLSVMSNAVLRLGGLFNTDAREFTKVRDNQFEQPWVLDSSAAQQTFGLTPTPLDDALRTML